MNLVKRLVRNVWCRLLIILFLAIWVVPVATSGESTLSDEAFEDLKIKVQSTLDAVYKAAEATDEVFPGATVAFVLPNGRIAVFATGFSDIEEQIPMESDARMPAGSIGKTYVAAVALDMAQDGTLDLDKKISHWLESESWFKRLPNSDTITLRNLLNHSSGIIDHVFNMESGFQDYAKEFFNSSNEDVPFDPMDLVQFVLDREPLFPAGEGFSYTDTGYILVGLIIEKASGSTYYEELDRRLLRPLELERTTAQNRRDIAGLAQGYMFAGQELFGLPLKSMEDNALVFDPSIEWTGGGLVSNPKDLVRWAKMLYEGKAMSSPYLGQLLDSVAQPKQGHDASGRAYGYGLGVNISRTEFGTTFDHSGFFPGYNSQLAYFPEYSIAIAMQINTDSSSIGNHFNEIAKIIIAALSIK